MWLIPVFKQILERLKQTVAFLVAQRSTSQPACRGDNIFAHPDELDTGHSGWRFFLHVLRLLRLIFSMFGRRPRQPLSLSVRAPSVASSVSLLPFLHSIFNLMHMIRAYAPAACLAT